MSDHYIVRIEPRARGGYVASLMETVNIGMHEDVFERMSNVQAIGIGVSPQEALLAAAKQWAGEHN